MTKFKLLLVEDDAQEINNCKDAIRDFKEEQDRHFELVHCENLEGALQKLDNTYDGAIVDLRLGNDGDEGGKVIERINESLLRIPVAVFTGTPNEIDSDDVNLGVYKRDDTEYADILEIFWGIYSTGLTRIMGGRGIIEETLNKVFQKSLIQQRNKWIEYGKQDSEKTEKALLRYTLNHLLQLIDDETHKSFPEEMYLYPPLTNKIQTGSIVEETGTDRKYAVMTPACDLAQCKTDRILLIEIDLLTELFPEAAEISGPISNTLNSKLTGAIKNNNSGNYHCLHKTDFFDGGFLNFRKILTLTENEFYEKFNPPKIQISPSFVKDVLARFSSFYARQGQPDIDHKFFLEQIITPKNTE